MEPIFAVDADGETPLSVTKVFAFGIQSKNQGGTAEIMHLRPFIGDGDFFMPSSRSLYAYIIRKGMRI